MSAPNLKYGSRLGIPPAGQFESRPGPGSGSAWSRSRLGIFDVSMAAAAAGLAAAAAATLYGVSPVRLGRVSLTRSESSTAAHGGGGGGGGGSACQEVHYLCAAGHRRHGRAVQVPGLASRSGSGTLSHLSPATGRRMRPSPHDRDSDSEGGPALRVAPGPCPPSASSQPVPAVTRLTP
jgi:hypothetical protein